MFFSVWGGFFSQFKGLFCPFFFYVEAFLLRLSRFGLFSQLKSLSATFFSMWGPFCYVFLLMRGFFSLFEGPFATFFSLCFFSPFKGLSATFFLYVEAFLLRFFFWWGGGFFSPFEGLSATFFLHVGVLFLFYEDPFWLTPHLIKIPAGAHACVSLNPYE